MPAPKMTREAVVESIGELFRRHGYDGTSLSLISKTTGLGRASLYHYFPGGKEEMGREVFAHIGASVRENMLDPLQGAGSPAERLAAWTSGVERFYDSGRKNCLLGAMVLSGGVDRYTQEIATTMRTLIDALASLLREAGIPARVARRRAAGALASVQGALITARGLGDPKLFREAIRDLPDSMLRPADGSGTGC